LNVSVLTSLAARGRKKKLNSDRQRPEIYIETRKI
jgi:hypothetical protein